MKTNKFLTIITLALFLSVLATSCKNEPSKECLQFETASKQLAENIKMYKTTWDEILNKGQIDEINEVNFDSNITLITSPENIVGIEAVKAFYKNYVDGFSNISFTIVDVFGQGNKIVKHWNFKGTHTGELFGISATGNEVDFDGVTIVKIKDGKIAQEQDFFDNLEFMQQLGIIPRE